MAEVALVLDAGTTNTKVALVNSGLKLVWRSNVINSKQHFQTGWVEQDPQELADSAITLIRQAAAATEDEIIGIGLTNQRETVVLWDKQTGQSLYPAIAWEDKRTAAYCGRLAKDHQVADYIRQTTGLVINPYFSASKIKWLIEHLHLKESDFDQIACGTIDSWLLYKLTGKHLTDYTNASRTLLFNIRDLAWDKKLLAIFGIPEKILPTVLPSSAGFGTVTLDSKELPIQAVVGDQQASLYAAGTSPGTVKVTYGTGIFPMRLIGEDFAHKDGYLTTLAVGQDNRPVYAWEGKVEDAAARTTPLLNQPQKLSAVVKRLARETDAVLQPLLEGIKTVTVDGGISQNNDLVAEQAVVSKVKIRRLPNHDGSILGVAKLIFERRISHVK